MKEKLFHAIQAAALASAIALPACGGESNHTITSTTTETDSPTQNSTDQETQQYLTDLLKVTKVDSIKLPGVAIPTQIFNASGYTLDTQAAVNVYNFLGNMVKQPTSVGNRIKPTGENWNIVIQPNAALTKRSMFLINSRLPKPSWGSQLDGNTALEKGISSSYVSTDTVNTSLYKSEAQGMSSIFLTEACQSTLIVALVNPTTNTYDSDPTEQAMAQELFCNSLGTALLARMTGMDYAKYEDLRKHNTINLPSIGLKNQVPIDIPQDVYNSIPSQIQILR